MQCKIGTFNNEWNKLNDNLRKANSIHKFKDYLTKFIKV